MTAAPPSWTRFPPSPSPPPPATPRSPAPTPIHTLPLNTGLVLHYVLVPRQRQFKASLGSARQDSVLRVTTHHLFDLLKKVLFYPK